MRRVDARNDSLFFVCRPGGAGAAQASAAGDSTDRRRRAGPDAGPVRCGLCTTRVAFDRAGEVLRALLLQALPASTERRLGDAFFSSSLLEAHRCSRLPWPLERTSVCECFGCRHAQGGVG